MREIGWKTKWVLVRAERYGVEAGGGYTNNKVGVDGKGWGGAMEAWGGLHQYQGGG